VSFIIGEIGTLLSLNTVEKIQNISGMNKHYGFFKNSEENIII